MIRRILNLKHTILNNHFRDIKNHVYIHLAVGIGLIFIMFFGGTSFFYLLFKFLLRQEVFGPLLMNMLIGMVFLSFFSMLIFSNLIVTLTTSYISKETDYFMSLPLNYKDIFVIKFIEAIIYSSWAFAILSLPFFLAFTLARDINLLFFPLVLILVLPFIVIPAGIGGIITMVISAYFPARRTRTLSIVLGGVAIAISVALVRVMRLGKFLATTQEEQFSQVLAFLNIGSVPVLPNYWMTQGMLSAANATAKGITWSEAVPYLKDYIFWLCLLLSSALMVVQVALWLIKPLFYRGWELSRESASKTTTEASAAIYVFIEKLLFFIPRQIQCLIIKDLKTFWRDPTQWTQLVILFGLLFIYIANLKNVSAHSGGLINLTLPKWQMYLSFFNLAATCFILSILTTRFVYPMLSLEGKQFWIIGLAPLNREKIVWQKYWVCLITSLIISMALIYLSNRILSVDLFVYTVSIINVFVMCLGLTSLAVGLGAGTPNFKEDNPARIANGLGGTLNVVLSMIYISGGIMLCMYPTTLHLFGKLTNNVIFHSTHTKWLFLNTLGFMLFHYIFIFIPMRFGIKKWKNIEF